MCDEPNGKPSTPWGSSHLSPELLRDSAHHQNNEVIPAWNFVRLITVEPGRCFDEVNLLALDGQVFFFQGRCQLHCHYLQVFLTVGDEDNAIAPSDMCDTLPSLPSIKRRRAGARVFLRIRANRDPGNFNL